MTSALLSPNALPPLRPAATTPQLADMAVDRRKLPDGGPPLGENEVEPVKGEMSFREFLSGLNPLQHLPGVGAIYRAVTGDVAPASMRVLGGLLTGGPLGFGAAVAGVLFDAATSNAATSTATAPAPATLARAQSAYRSNS